MQWHYGTNTYYKVVPTFTNVLNNCISFGRYRYRTVEERTIRFIVTIWKAR
jgi:hypothetical protein